MRMYFWMVYAYRCRYAEQMTMLLESTLEIHQTVWKNFWKDVTIKDRYCRWKGAWLTWDDRSEWEADWVSSRQLLLLVLCCGVETGSNSSLDWLASVTTGTVGAVLSSCESLTLGLVLGGIGGGRLDDMVLSSSYVACCVVQVDRSSRSYRRWV